MKKQRAITRKTTLAEAMKRYPETAKVFVQYGLHCVGCKAAPLETVEIAAHTHGIRDMEKLLDDLNKAAE